MTDNLRADRPFNVEAGSYIEDDPEAWVAWVMAVNKYGPMLADVQRQFGREDGSEVVAGAMLSFLADQHGLYLSRALASPSPEPLDVEAGLKAMREREQDLRWCNKNDDCHTKAEGVALAIDDFLDATRLSEDS